MSNRPRHISVPRILRSQRGATYTLVFAVALPAITLLTVGLVDVSRFIVARDDLGAALEQSIMSVEGDLRGLNMTAEGVIPPAESECSVRGGTAVPPCTRSTVPTNVEALNPAAARQLAISACARAAAILVGGSSIFNYQYVGSAQAAPDDDPIAAPLPDEVWNELSFAFAVYKSDGSQLTTFSSATANAGEPSYCTTSADAAATGPLRVELQSEISSLVWSAHPQTGGEDRPTYWLAGKITSQVDGLFSKYLTGSTTNEVSTTFIRALPWPYSLETN